MVDLDLSNYFLVVDIESTLIDLDFGNLQEPILHLL